MITFKYSKSKLHTITIINDSEDDSEISDLYIPNKINGEEVNPNIYDIIICGTPLKVKTLEIAEGFCSFDKDAFRNIKFKNLVFPSSLTHMSPQMFTANKNIEAIYFPPDSKLTTIPHECFSYCFNLREISLGKDISDIGENAFFDCKSLSKIEFISEKELILGNDAFQGTSNLYDLDMSKWNLKVIPRRCFSHSALKKIQLPSVLEGIYENAFYDTPLLYCSFPKTLKCIRPFAFSHTCLTHIDVEKDANLCQVYAYAFSCTAFSSLKIPSNFVFIGSAHFASNDKLISIDLSDNDINVINESMFTTCKNLRHIKFGNIIKIEKSAFFECNIENLQLPNSLEEIDELAFAFNSLERVDISNTNVNYIGNGAFTDNKINSVKLNYFITNIHTNAFDNNPIRFENIIAQAPFAEVINQ